MLYLCCRFFGLRWIAFREIWIFAFITLASVFSYYYYSAAIAEFKFSLGITRNIILQQALTSFCSQESRDFFSANIPRAMGLTGLLLTLAGVFTAGKKQMILLVWFGAMCLELIFIVSPIKAAYYLIFALVPCTLLMGNLLDRLFQFQAGKIISLVLVLWLARESFYLVKPMYTVNEVLAMQTKVVQELTAKSDLLVVGSFDPCVLSLSGRRGWRYHLGIYSFVPKDPYEELACYISQGAKYFVPIQGKVYGDENERLISYIEKKYRKIEPVAGYPVFILQEELSPS
jgi:hypothetical protein